VVEVFGGSGFAYDAMRRTARAIEQRRADRAYWREVRRVRRVRSRPRGLAARAASPDVDRAIADQLDHGVFLASSRNCPACGESFVLIHVRGVELDTCLECGSFWLDAGEFGDLSAHREVLSRCVDSGPSRFCCPVCAGPMREREPAGAARLRVDACCHGHGVFFQRGELRRLLESPACRDEGRDGD
jgi:Zn-finger nucleic acid-binding protein